MATDMSKIIGRATSDSARDAGTPGHAAHPGHEGTLPLPRTRHGSTGRVMTKRVARPLTRPHHQRGRI
jgi:hypothetical protein